MTGTTSTKKSRLHAHLADGPSKLMLGKTHVASLWLRKNATKLPELLAVSPLRDEYLGILRAVPRVPGLQLVDSPFGGRQTSYLIHSVNLVKAMHKAVSATRALHGLPEVTLNAIYRIESASTGADYETKFALRCARLGLGLEEPSASDVGRLGGTAKTPKKAAAVASNGLNGGRPTQFPPAFILSQILSTQNCMEVTRVHAKENAGSIHYSAEFSKRGAVGTITGSMKSDEYRKLEREAVLKAVNVSCKVSAIPESFTYQVYVRKRQIEFALKHIEEGSIAGVLGTWREAGLSGYITFGQFAKAHAEPAGK